MRTPALVTCGLALMLALLAGCGSQEGQEGSGSPSGSERTTSSQEETKLPAEQSPATTPKPDDEAAQGAKVKVIDTDFRPVKVTIAAGSTVHWKQIGDQPHSVTAADESFDSSPECGPLDSDMCLGEGDRFSHTFKQAGEFTYYCRVHGLPDGTGMVGTIIVR